MNDASTKSSLSDRELLALIEELNRRGKLNKLATYFPATGPLRRELYKRHMRFFALGGRHEPGPECPPDCKGAPHRERLFMAANRVGKTESAGGYELTCHLTGRYPAWWPGLRFTHPIDSWAAGTTKTGVRDILQLKLLGTADIGRRELIGTGLIPGRDIVRVTPWHGVPGLAETVVVKSVFGGESVLAMKAYEQGRKSFEGTNKHVVLLDEECPLDIYVEAFTRTMTCNGHVLATFTPLQGLTPLILEFLPNGKLPI